MTRNIISGLQQLVLSAADTTSFLRQQTEFRRTKNLEGQRETRRGLNEAIAGWRALSVSRQRTSARTSCSPGSSPPTLHSPASGCSSSEAANARCAATGTASKLDRRTTHAQICKTHTVRKGARDASGTVFCEQGLKDSDLKHL
ncbi:unnamed protein product [Symbiodinium sp. CCMP2592]|nr:unnamed protein product [Symbiodinium sp. CCMP2592]